jgi:hypothetical protein
MMTAEDNSWWNTLLAIKDPAIPPLRFIVPRYELTEAQKKGRLLPHEQPELVWILPCPLLALPRELRDSIWSYSLSHDDGLDGHLNTLNDTIIFHTRNIVASRGPRFNELQHVNKQLYQETQGVALRNNDLYFDKHDYKPVKRGFNRVEQVLGICNVDVAVRFLAESSPNLKASLRKVIINFGHGGLRQANEERSTVTTPQDVFSVITDGSPLSLFCREHPKATVIVRFRMTDYASVRFRPLCKLMLAWQISLRGCTTIRVPQEALPQIWADPAYEEEVRAIREGSKLIKNLPQNLRISILERCGERDKPDEAIYDWNYLAKVKEVLDDVEEVFWCGM